MKTLLSTFAACLALVGLTYGQDHPIENLRPTGDLTPLRTAVGVIPLARGGTGATTAAGARSALGTTDASNITIGILDAARLPGPLGASSYTVPDRLLADHAGWKVGDIVNQTGGPGAAESFEISINADVPDNGLDYGLGLYISDANAAGGGSAYVVVSYENSPVSAAQVASDLMSAINGQCDFVTATASGNTVYVNGYNNGAVLFTPYFDDAGEGNQIDALATVDTPGVDLAVPGTFLVTDAIPLGTDSGYVGLGNAFLSGGGPPDPSLGTFGNGYIDVNSGEYYQLTDTGWVDILNLKGPPGTTGQTGVNGSPGRNYHPTLTSTQLSQVALLQYFPLLAPYTTYSSVTAYGLCFDGTNVWGTSLGKVAAYLNGSLVRSYSITPINAHYIYYSCFDGTNIWAVDNSQNAVIKLRASDASLVGTYPVGNSPFAPCFDGTNIWVTNNGSTTVSKILASNGSLVGAYQAGVAPRAICFDGTNIWVTNSSASNVTGNSSTVTKLLASSGAIIGTYTVGVSPNSICFDGTNIWVANNGNGIGTVTKLFAGSGGNLGTYPVAGAATSICFDGQSIWVGTTNGTENLSLTGQQLGSLVPTNSFVYGLCFDGANMWIQNANTRFIKANLY